MDVFDAVRTVLAVRNYQSKPIPPDVVRQIVESAWLTASASNKQPWHFIVVQNPDTLKKLGDLARTGRYIPQAPLAVVVVIEDSQLALSDASRAIQSMVLTAWEHGVGSNWVGFFGLEEVKPFLNIPENLKILAIIPFGYPDQPAGKGKKNRKPFGDVVQKEKYGQPFSE